MVPILRRREEKEEESEEEEIQEEVVVEEVEEVVEVKVVVVVVVVVVLVRGRRRRSKTRPSEGKRGQEMIDTDTEFITSFADDTRKFSRIYHEAGHYSAIIGPQNLF